MPEKGNACKARNIYLKGKQSDQHLGKVKFASVKWEKYPERKKEKKMCVCKGVARVP